MDELLKIKEELAHLSRLALSEKGEDVRLLVARLVRKYRKLDPEFADKLDSFLQSGHFKTRSPLRKKTVSVAQHTAMPVDNESRLSLLKEYHDSADFPAPILSTSLQNDLEQLVLERGQIKKLHSLGLKPTQSSIFVGPPGVGKTFTARWLASQLELPFYALDLTAVMSSLLGRSGANLRAAIDFAKRTPCVLLLDEIDAIAKRRGDDSDVGELKRLVTVMLQEVEDWKAHSLLLAATNHPELIDPALWRRFDLILNFDIPDESRIREAVSQFFAGDSALMRRWGNVLASSFLGQSYSDIERDIQRFRKTIALGVADESALVENMLTDRVAQLDGKTRKIIAVDLANQSKLSQHAINRITGVSRDTIRKHTLKDAQVEEAVEG